MPRDMSGNEQRKMRRLRDRAFFAQRGRCWWCETAMLGSAQENHPMAVSAEHLIPRKDGGPTTEGNIVAAHRKCNSERHAGESDQTYTVGDDTSHSPFEILAGRI